MIRRGIEWTFDADTSRMVGGLRAAAGGLEGLKDEAQQADRALRGLPDSVDVDVDVDLRSGALEALRARLRTQMDTLQRDINIDPDIDATKALSDLRRIERQLRQLDRMDVDVDVDIDRGGGMSGALGRLSDVVEGMLGSVPALGGAFAKLPPQVSVAAAAATAAVAGLAAAWAGTAFVGGGAAAAVGGGTLAFLDAYIGDAQEARKWTVVFGDELQKMEGFADRLAARTGLINDDVLLASAGIADLLKPQGFSESDAAGISRVLTERAAALAKFSGRDVTEGVTAVTSALTGSSRSLKQFGIDLSKSNIDAQIETLSKSRDGFDKLTDSQQRVIAIQEEIKRQGTDSWRAWSKGATGAEDVVYGFRSTLEGLKDVALGGFGDIINDLIGDFQALSGTDYGFTDAPQALADWIEENRDSIRRFFIDVAEFAAAGAEAFVAFGEQLLRMVAFVAPTLENWFQYLLTTAGGALIVMGKLGQINPLTRAAGEAMEDQGRAAAGMADAMEGLGGKTARGANRAADALRGFRRNSLDPFLSDIRKLGRLEQFRLDVKAGNLDKVREDLKKLSKRELVEIETAIPDGTKNKTLRQLEDMTRRRRAEIIAEALGLNPTAKKLDDIAESRDADIVALLQGEDTVRAGINSLTGAQGTATVSVKPVMDWTSVPGKVIDFLLGTFNAPVDGGTAVEDEGIAQFGARGAQAPLRRMLGVGGGTRLRATIAVTPRMVASTDPVDKLITRIFTNSVEKRDLKVELGGSFRIDESQTIIEKYRDRLKDIDKATERISEGTSRLGDVFTRMRDKPKTVDELRGSVLRLVKTMALTGRAGEMARMLGMSKRELAAFRDGAKVSKDEISGMARALRGWAKDAEKSLTRQSEKLLNWQGRVSDFLSRVQSVSEGIRSAWQSTMETVSDAITGVFDPGGALTSAKEAYRGVLQDVSDFTKTAEELRQLNPRELAAYTAELADLQRKADSFSFAGFIAEAAKADRAMDRKKVVEGWKQAMGLQLLAAKQFTADLGAIQNSAIAAGLNGRYGEGFVGELMSYLGQMGTEAGGELARLIAEGLASGDTSMLDALAGTFDGINEAAEQFVALDGVFSDQVYRGVVAGFKSAKADTEAWFKKHPLRVTARLVAESEGGFTVRKPGARSVGAGALSVTVQGGIVDPAGAAAAIRRVLRQQDAREGAWSW